eukprot:1188497-Prorocentrum_minimum.AAC.3
MKTEGGAHCVGLKASRANDQLQGLPIVLPGPGYPPHLHPPFKSAAYEGRLWVPGPLRGGLWQVDPNIGAIQSQSRALNPDARGCVAGVLEGAVGDMQGVLEGAVGGMHGVLEGDAEGAYQLNFLHRHLVPVQGAAW